MARWVCPYCNHPRVYNEKNSAESVGLLWLGTQAASFTPASFALLCLNDECSKTSLHFSIFEYNRNRSDNRGDLIESWGLWPETQSKPQPDYIPIALRNDYDEACLIRDKSPKSAATLARRCLQGMIRDFCGIQKGTLGGEIEVLRKRVEDGTAPAGVSPESVDGIDAVRSIGSIGAHMEKDINIIVDVEPDEAQILIDLIETLFDEWYVARHARAQRFARVAAIAAEKKAFIAEEKQKLLPPAG